MGYDKDHVKPELGTFIVIHSITIIPSPKMDTPGLVAAVCTCGLYRSSPSTENEARKSGQQHVDAKTGL